MGETENNKKIGYYDKILDFIFSNNPIKWLLLIVFLGFILRLIVAGNTAPVPDEMVHGTHAIGFISLNALSTMTQGPLWFFLTDISYRIFDVTLYSARFPAILFGTLTIILIYLISNLFFEKRIGLVSAFIFAISPFSIRWTSIYMDVSMMFFILFAVYFFIIAYKKDEISLLSAVFLGIASLIKIIAFVFALVFYFFILIMLYKNYHKDKNLFKKNLKRGFIFMLIMFFIFLPVFSYNYFLYKEKQLVDLPFAMYFNINPKFYQGAGLAHGQGFSPQYILESLKTVIMDYFIPFDPLLFVLGILGMILAFKYFKSDKTSFLFLVSLIIFPLFFIAISILLPTHYTSFLPLLAIFGGFCIIQISDFFKKFISNKNIIIWILIIFLVFSFYSLSANLTSKSAVDKMRNYAILNIDKDTLVIADSRIYRGIISWMFNDKHYIEASFFQQLMQYNDQLKGDYQNVRVIFIECAIDDCGWGTIGGQPEFNKSMEDFVSLFQNITNQKKIYGGGGEDTKIPYFKIYDFSLKLNPKVLSEVDKTHEFFFYPVRRYLNPEKSFDYYEVKGGLDSLINLIAHIILYCSILFSLISIIILFYELFFRNHLKL